MKVCKNCHRIYESASTCPQCPDGKNSDFSERFNSSAMVLDPENSQIAKKLGFKTAGLYAIKVR